MLCALPHFKISFSAHVTFNEADFPFREQCRVDPIPFSLFEEQAGQEFRHVASGESWGTTGELGLERGRALLNEKGPVGAHIAVESSFNSGRECGQRLSVGTTSLEPLLGGVTAGRQMLPPGELPQRPRAIPQVPRPLSGCGLAGNVAPTGQQRVGFPGYDSNSFAPSSGTGSQVGLPAVPGSQGLCAPDEGLRRSSRSWKPSTGCLEGIAFVSRELAWVEAEMDETDIAQTQVGEHLVGQFGMAGGAPGLQDNTESVSASSTARVQRTRQASMTRLSGSGIVFSLLQVRTSVLKSMVKR